LNCTRSAKNLANVYIGAVRVDLRVVHVEDGRVNIEVGRDLFTGIVSLHDVSRRAVLASVADADISAWYQV